MFFDHVERLDALPRHVALHPCGVVLSDTTLLDRTPVEARLAGVPDEPGSTRTTSRRWAC
nr:hypothetical protein [Angustibacter aerolatus]